MARKHGSVELCINIADALLSVGKEYNNRDKAWQTSPILPVSEAFWAIPAVINIAFACELYLKGLGLAFNTQKDGVLSTHDLKDLFDDLPQEIQVQAEKEYESRTSYPITLLQTLEQHAHSFDCWRYIYEPENQKSEAYIDNLLLAAEVLKGLYTHRKELV